MPDTVVWKQEERPVEMRVYVGRPGAVPSEGGRGEFEILERSEGVGVKHARDFFGGCFVLAFSHESFWSADPLRARHWVGFCVKGVAGIFC